MKSTNSNSNGRFLAQISPAKEAAQQANECLEFLGNRLVAYPTASLKFLLLAAVTKPCVRVLLIGKHGSGKSTAARLLGTLLDKKTAVYNAAVDDLISIAGIPNTKLFANGDLGGEIPFVAHGRSIWDKQVVHCDELNRATAENQNVFLEPLSERTLYGRNLPMELFIATINPDADDRYLGVMPLDAALRDRFDLVLEVPETASLMESELQQVARVNIFGDRRDICTPGVDKLIVNLERRRQLILESNAMVEAISEWCGHVVATLIQIKPDHYVSQRTIAQFSRITTDALAFETLLWPLTTEIVRQLLFDITKVCLGNKLGLCPDEVQAGVRAQEVNTVLQQLVRLDQIDNISIGPLPARIRQLERLDTQLSRSDTLRVQLAVTELLKDTNGSGFTAAQHLVRAIPAELDNARQEAEINVLNHRIQSLARFGNEVVESQRRHFSDRACYRLQSASAWRPSSRKWTRSFFRSAPWTENKLAAQRNESNRFAFSLDNFDQNHELASLESGLWLITHGNWAENLLLCLEAVDPTEFGSMHDYLELLHTSSVRSRTDAWFGVVGCRSHRNGFTASNARIGSALLNTPFASDEIRYVFRIPRQAVPSYFAATKGRFAQSDRVFHPASLITNQLRQQTLDLEAHS